MNQNNINSTESIKVINCCKHKLELRTMPDELVVSIISFADQAIEKNAVNMSQFFYGNHELFRSWLTSVYIKGAFGGGSFNDVLRFFSGELESTTGLVASLNEVLFVLINNDVGQPHYEAICTLIANYGYHLVINAINERKSENSAA